MTQTLEPTTGTEPSAARTRVETWLADFEAALAARDVDRAAGLFATTSFWRDLIAFTWNFTTVENRDGVADLLAADHGVDRRDELPDHRGRGARGGRRVVTAWFRFETAVGRGSGLLRLNDEGAWTFLTTLDELKGHEENQGTNRPRGVEHGAQKDRVTWRERRTAELEGFGRDREPYVAVIGGGQGGIALGARLRQLGVDHVVVDRHARPGDQWRSRYKSLCLHDPVWYDHLPYLPFPRNWPVFAPKDKIGDWLEMYTRVMEVNYWGSTTAKTPPGTTRRRSGRSPSTATARRSCSTPSSSSSPSVCPASRTSRRFPARTSSPASSTTARSTPARTPTRTSASSSSARTTPRSTSAGRCGRSART